MMFRFNYMMLTVMIALSVFFLSSLTISSCDLCTLEVCKTVFVANAVYMSDLIKLFLNFLSMYA